MAQESLDEYAAKVQRQYDHGIALLQGRHVEWAETIAYTFGVEPDTLTVGGRHITYEQVQAALNKMRGRSDGDLVRYNYLLSHFRTLVGGAVQQLPQPIVAQMRDDWDAAEARDAQEALLRFLIMRDASNFAEAEERSVSWAILTGTGFFGVHWDKMLGPPVWTPQTTRTGEEQLEVKKGVRLRNGGHAWQTVHGVFVQDSSGSLRSTDIPWAEIEFASDPSGHPIVDEIVVPVGKFENRGTEVFWAPMTTDVIPDPAPTWDSCPGVIVRAAVRKELLVAVFGAKAKRCSETIYGQGALGFEDWIGDVDTLTGDPLVLVLYRFDRPSPVHPVGRYGIVAGGVTLWRGPLPVGRLPLEPIYDTMNPTGIWGVSSMRQGVAPQRVLNAGEQDLRQIVRNTAQPKTIVREGTLVDGVSIPTEPGAIIRIAANSPPDSKPSYMEAPQVPALIANQPERAAIVMQDTIGVHGPTMGDQSGINSGRQAAIAQASDNRKFTGTVNSLARAMGRVCKTALLLWRENADPRTTIAVYGPDGLVVGAMAFDKNKYLSDDMEVTIQASALMPYNEEVRRQQLLELQTMGLIESAEEFWRMLGRSGIGSLRRSDYHSRLRAREEIALIRKGRQPRVMDHEDHAAHIDVHLQFMRSPMFYREPQAVQQTLLNHFRQHYQFMAMQQTGQAPGQGAMYGNAQRGLTGQPQPQQTAPKMIGPGQPLLPMDEGLYDQTQPNPSQPWTAPSMRTPDGLTQAGLDKEAEGSYGLQ